MKKEKKTKKVDKKKPSKYLEKIKVEGDFNKVFKILVDSEDLKKEKGEKNS